MNCKNLEPNSIVCISLFQDKPLASKEISGPSGTVKSTREGSNGRNSTKQVPGTCLLSYAVQANDTCESIAKTNNISNFMELNPSACCGSLNSNHSVCLKGLPHLPEKISEIKTEMANVNSTLYCHPEHQAFNSTLHPNNHTSVDPEVQVPIKSEEAKEEEPKKEEPIKKEDPKNTEPKKVAPAKQEQDPPPKAVQSEPPSWLSQSWIHYHNQCRSQICGVHSRVSWSDSLASYVSPNNSQALSYARTLASMCYRRPPHAVGVIGENLFFGPIGSMGDKPKTGVGMWCSENLHDGPNHISQVCAIGLTLVGCGYASCASMEYVVCRYNVGNS